MKKLLKAATAIGIIALALVGCSKKSAKMDVDADEDYFVPELDAPFNPFAAQESNFDSIPESPISDFSYELTDDNEGVKITSYKGGRECRIPAEIEGMPVVELTKDMFHKGVFQDDQKVSVVVMPDTVKTIGEELFASAKYLKSVKLSSSLTVIPRNTFVWCEALETITIPESVTTIGEYAFRDSGLKSIYIPDTVTEIFEDAFWHCEKLENVRLSSSLKTLPGSIFVSCKSLKTVSLPNGITEIGHMAFSGCKALSSLVIPNSVTKIGDMAFQECESLTSLEIPNSVTSIGEEAFDESGLVTLEIPDTVTELECTFGKCKSLTKLRLPNSLEVISDKMFRAENYAGFMHGMASLQSVNLPASLKEVGFEAFSELVNLTELIIPDSLTDVKFGSRLVDPDLLFHKDSLTDADYFSKSFEGTSLNLATQKRLKDLGYTGKFTK